jgi:hypothetical protein
MAATLTGLNDTLISQIALNAFTASLAPLSKFSTSYNTDAARRGTVISVPIVANITATTASEAYESADAGSASNADITLNQYRKATVGIKDSQFHGSSFADIEKFAFQQGKAVAVAISQALMTSLVCTTGYFQTVTVTSGAVSFALSHVRSARKALAAAGVAIEDAALILNNDSFNTLLGDSTNLLANLAFGGDAIKEGKLPRVLGLDAMEVSSIPSTGNTLGFVAHPSAIALAVRPLTPQDDSLYISSKVITDEASGLSMTYRRHYSLSLGTHFVTFEALAGWTAGVTQGLARFAY